MMPAIQEIVNRSEKYFKTDIRYLASGGFWTTLGYLLQVGLGVVNTIVLANLLAKDLLGTYQFVLAMAGVLSVLTLSGMGTAIARAVAQGHDEAFRSGVYTKLFWSVGMFISALSIAGYYWYQNDINLALAFLFVALTIPLTESFILYESYLQGKQAFKDSALLGFWRKPLPVITLITTLYFTTHVPTLIGVYLGTTLLSTFLVYLSVIKKYQPPIGKHPETVTYSKQLSIMNILGRLAEHADKVILWYVLGPVAVASFAIAQLATKYSGGLINIASHIALPKVAKRSLSDLQHTLPRKVWLFTLILLPLVAIYITLIPVLFGFLFPAYPESVLLAQVLGLSILIIPQFLYGQVLFAHKQTRGLYIVSVVAPLIKIGAMAGMIFFFGVWGAVYGLLIGEAAMGLLLWYFFMSARQVSPETAQQSD